MKKFLIAAVAAATLTTGFAGAAQAAPWMSINARQAMLEQRINVAQRTHRISYREAQGIRAQFRQIARLEANYRRSRPGLTNWERADLDRRFDALSGRIRYESRDRDGRRW
jgi:Ni/Co efflux regulator RcnB